LCVIQFLARVPPVCDFGSITLLFSGQMPDTVVLENNRVTLLKSQTEVHEAEIR
jgi:hypothetical protein